MTERDFALLGRYAQKWMLPTRRLQMQIARLCQITAGNKDATLGSFLFDPDPPPPTEAPPTEEVAAMAAETFGAGVYVLGRGRKKKE